jgi:hypothetical protein
MFRGPRRKRSRIGRPPEAGPALQALRAAARSADRAKEALLAAVPHGRGPGAPLAEALAAFEEHLVAGRRSIAEWPVGTAEPERRAASAAIEESLRRAEALRLNASPEGYEQLYALLGETLDPLDALAEVAERLEGTP